MKDSIHFNLKYQIKYLEILFFVCPDQIEVDTFRMKAVDIFISQESSPTLFNKLY